MALFAYSSAAAQQIQPRIAGLETNERYMSLLLEDHSLSQREDSITVVVEVLRASYRSSAADSDSSRDQIISFENQLFELRARKATLVDSLNLIEQNWVLNNLGAGQSVVHEQAELIVTSPDVKYIHENPNVEANLSKVDYRNLVKAEEMEARAEQLNSNYIINYDNLVSLKRSYELTQQQTEADDIKHHFDSLSMANTQILEQLGNTWGFIYDNKSFAYSLLMELLGFNDVLSIEAELMRKAQAEISANQGQGGGDESLYYTIQKNSMVEYEVVVAQRLGLINAADSLSALSKRLSAVERSTMPTISIEERLFIHYEPFEIVANMPYTTANPIPELVTYDKGTIFRILVGSFQTKQPATTFRNTIPVAHSINDMSRHCYHIGGYATYEEAVEVQEQLREHGFRSPQVVVWVDGRERNLTKEPLAIETTYRIDILETTTLAEGVTDAVGSAQATISKVGNDKFVITSLSRQRQVDSLVNELRSIDPQLNIVVDRKETEIEF